MINDLRRGQHQRRLHYKPKSFWGPPRPPDPRQILLILCSVMGITIIIVKIISLHRKSSKVAEVKKSLATYAFIEGKMVSKR